MYTIALCKFKYCLFGDLDRRTLHIHTLTYNFHYRQSDEICNKCFCYCVFDSFLVQIEKYQKESNLKKIKYNIKMILPLIISNTGDMKENWFIWKEVFLDYMKSNNYDERPEEYKINVLRSLLGNDALRISSVQYIFNYRSHKHKFTTLRRILKSLDGCFSNMKNELVERYNFFTRYQQKDEPIETYTLDLIEKAKTCNFGNQRDSIIRDKVIASIQCQKLRSKLFQTLNLNLRTLLQISKAHEVQNKYNNVVKKTQTNALHSDEIALVEASNNNSKEVAEGKQNSNDKVNGKITVQAMENSKNDKSDRAKTDTKVDNCGSDIKSTNCKENTTNIDNKARTNSKNDIRNNNIIMTTNRRHSDNSNKAKTDTKVDNSGSDIKSTACKENNTNIGDKTKTNPKNDKSDKAKADTKVDNSGSDIKSTNCKENTANIDNKAKTNSKNDIRNNNIIITTNRRHSDNSNYVRDMELVFGKNTNDINDKDNIDSKGMNNNPNMNTARRNSVLSGIQYGRNCRHKCKNCGELNNFPNCCQMKPLKTTEQHINMSSVERENLLNPNHFQHNNQPQPIPQSNYLANIEPCYLPSAPLFCEIENELYPKLSKMSNVLACALQNPEATVDNTEPEAAATNTQNHKKRSNSDTCSIS